MAAPDLSIQDGGQGNVKLHPYLITLVRWCVSSLWSTATVLIHRLMTTPLQPITGAKTPRPKTLKFSAGKDHLHPEPTVDCQILHKPERHTIDVIFVHGLYGSLGNTWRQGDWRHKYKTQPQKTLLRNHPKHNCCQNSYKKPIYNENKCDDNEQMTLTQINEKLSKKIIPSENELITEQFYNNTLLDQTDNYETQGKFVTDMFKRDNCDKDCDDDNKGNQNKDKTKNNENKFNLHLDNGTKCHLNSEKDKEPNYNIKKNDCYHANTNKCDLRQDNNNKCDIVDSVNEHYYNEDNEYNHNKDNVNKCENIHESYNTSDDKYNQDDDDECNHSEMNENQCVYSQHNVSKCDVNQGANNRCHDKNFNHSEHNENKCDYNKDNDNKCDYNQHNDNKCNHTANDCSRSEYSENKCDYNQNNDNKCDYNQDNDSKCDYNEINESNECVCDEKNCETGCGCICSECYSTCWPRDWIKVDFPGARVISINYTSDPYLWRPLWIKENKRLNLYQRADQMIEQLLAMRVGDKPIIWVGHSKGGLFIKQIFCEAYEAHMKENKNLNSGINERTEEMNRNEYNTFIQNKCHLQNDNENNGDNLNNDNYNDNNGDIGKNDNFNENNADYGKNDNFNENNGDNLNNDNYNENAEDNECVINETKPFENVFESQKNDIKSKSNDNYNNDSRSEDFQSLPISVLYRSSRGFMFYSVPHRGSPLADIKTPVTTRSIELLEIAKDCPLVLSLHSRWERAVCSSHVSVRSFVESCRTLMSVLWLKIVSVHSADAGIGTLHGVSVDHREICKPSSRNCLLYTELTALIRDAVNCQCRNVTVK